MPKEVTQEDKFLFFILHLSMLGNYVENLMIGIADLVASNFNEFYLPSYDALLGAALEIVIIKYQSYYDEFSHHKAIIPNKELQRTSNNALNANRKRWPGLKDYRNEILAHNYRNGRTSIFLEGKDKTYTIPRTLEEHLELALTLKEINLALLKEYPGQFEKIANRVEFVKGYHESQ